MQDDVRRVFVSVAGASNFERIFLWEVNQHNGYGNILLYLINVIWEPHQRNVYENILLHIIIILLQVHQHIA